MHRVSWSPPTLVIVVTGYFRPCGPAAGLQKVYASESTSSGPPGRAGYLNVRAMIGQSQDHQRKSLFTALDVAGGQITGQHYKRRGRKFLHFMNRIVNQHRGKEIHLVIDNPSTHKPHETRGWRGTRTSISTKPRRTHETVIVCSEFGLKAAAGGAGI
jgi:DDE superfamily endonuclease